MKPASSIVFFTTASGAGYGMLFWLGLLSALGNLPTSTAYGMTALFIALALITLGLLASTYHLGHPERAWRALSQWRTSWLSREGVAAIATYVPAVIFGLTWLLSGHGSPLAGVLAAALAVVTVICTAMIYASLKPIRQWSNRLVPAFYLLAALFSGAICLAGITSFVDPIAAQGLGLVSLFFGAAGAVVKFAYWRQIDTTRSTSTAASATGLGHLGKVRSFEAPHTDENYLLKEMGFRIARKHAAKLRAYALLATFALPLAILIGILAGPVPVNTIVPAALLAVLGMLLERWLFFAEATHTVVLYYGREA